MPLISRTCDKCGHAKQYGVRIVTKGGNAAWSLICERCDHISVVLNDEKMQVCMVMDEVPT